MTDRLEQPIEPVTQADKELRDALIGHWEDLREADIDLLLAASRTTPAPSHHDVPHCETCGHTKANTFCSDGFHYMETATPPIEPVTQAEVDEAYEMGKRDGYESAVQDIDLRTGGDGEYRYCTNGDPDRHTPTPEAMIERIVARTTPAPSLEYARGFEAGLHALKAMTAEEDAYHAPSQHSELADRLLHWSSEMCRSADAIREIDATVADGNDELAALLFEAANALRQPPSDAMRNAVIEECAKVADAEMSHLDEMANLIGITAQRKQIALGRSQVADSIAAQIRALTQGKPDHD
jgi:hypothetical protein